MSCKAFWSHTPANLVSRPHSMLLWAMGPHFDYCGPLAHITTTTTTTTTTRFFSNRLSSGWQILVRKWLQASWRQRTLQCSCRVRRWTFRVGETGWLHVEIVQLTKWPERTNGGRGVMMAVQLMCVSCLMLIRRIVASSSGPCVLKQSTMSN